MAILTLMTISLLVSFALSFSVLVLQYEAKLTVWFPAVVVFLKQQEQLNILLLISIYVYRRLCALDKLHFYLFVICSTVISTLFYLLRFYVLSHNSVALSSTFYIIGFFTFIISAVFAILRLFFRVGFILHQIPEASSAILRVAEKIASSIGFFSRFGRRLAGNLPPNPGAVGPDRQFVLGVGVLFSTTVAAGAGVYMGYIGYKGLKVAEVNAKAAETQAQAQVDMARSKDKYYSHKADILAVKHGLMSQEDYHKKYPPKS